MNFYSKQKRWLGDIFLLNFRLKGSILLAAVASISLQAQDNDVENSQLEQTQSAVTELENPAPETANLSDKVISSLISLKLTSQLVLRISTLYRYTLRPNSAKYLPSNCLLACLILR